MKIYIGYILTASLGFLGIVRYLVFADNKMHLNYLMIISQPLVYGENPIAFITLRYLSVTECSKQRWISPTTFTLVVKVSK